MTPSSEKYHVTQDRLFESDFDEEVNVMIKRMMDQLEETEKV